MSVPAWTSGRKRGSHEAARLAAPGGLAGRLLKARRVRCCPYGLVCEAHGFAREAESCGRRAKRPGCKAKSFVRGAFRLPVARLADLHRASGRGAQGFPAQARDGKRRASGFGPCRRKVLRLAFERGGSRARFRRRTAGLSAPPVEPCGSWTGRSGLRLRQIRSRMRRSGRGVQPAGWRMTGIGSCPGPGRAASGPFPAASPLPRRLAARGVARASPRSRSGVGADRAITTP